MDFKKHIEKAWHLTLKYLVPLLLITLVWFGVSIFSLGILAPVTMAGFMNALLRLMREGREPRVQDLFSQMHLFLPLLAFSIVLFIAVCIGFMLLVLPGIAVVLAVSFACFFMLPLMVDRRMGIVEAIKQSYAMAVKGNIVDHVVAVVLFIVITSVGGSVFIGALFTQPFATLMLLSIYEERLADLPAGGAPPPPPAEGIQPE